MKKSLILTAVVAFLFTSCDDFLERYPEGGTIRQDQYEKLSDQLEGSVRGLYSRLYSMGGSSHDEFGKRSIDLWGDILASDIALTGKTYGWLYTDEQMLTVNRTGTIWSHYYSQLHNINATILAFRNGTSFIKDLDTYGYPSETTEHKYSDLDYTNAIYYAQALGLRGYIYAQMAKLYTPEQKCTYMDGYTVYDYRCCPVYTELDMDTARAQSSSWEVYNRAFQDLELAIRLYEEFGEDYQRASKITLDHEVLCGIAAMAYLNESVYQTSKVAGLTGVSQEDILEKALKNAQKVIESGKYTIVPNKQLLSNGFNNIDDPSWIWGQKVTIETSGGLKSWFGQVDIHSYSYAWAGDTKVIDAELRNAAPDWDRRRLWFNNGKANPAYVDCPDKKFFTAANPTSTKDDDLDRDWLSDNVFMRYESILLIAAEAEYRLAAIGSAKGSYDNAIKYLNTITDERIKTNDEDDEAAYLYTNIYQPSLNDPNKLKEAIIYNWRMEMWGEGYGWETFRRWGESRKRGDNHDYGKGATINPSDTKFSMNIPSSESTYNPNIARISL